MLFFAVYKHNCSLCTVLSCSVFCLCLLFLCYRSYKCWVNESEQEKTAIGLTKVNQWRCEYCDNSELKSFSTRQAYSDYHFESFYSNEYEEVFWRKKIDNPMHSGQNSLLTHINAAFLSFSSLSPSHPLLPPSLLPPRCLFSPSSLFSLPPPFLSLFSSPPFLFLSLPLFPILSLSSCLSCSLLLFYLQSFLPLSISVSSCLSCSLSCSSSHFSLSPFLSLPVSLALSSCSISSHFSLSPFLSLPVSLALSSCSLPVLFLPLSISVSSCLSCSLLLFISSHFSLPSLHFCLFLSLLLSPLVPVISPSLHFCLFLSLLLSPLVISPSLPFLSPHSFSHGRGAHMVSLCLCDNEISKPSPPPPSPSKPSPPPPSPNTHTPPPHCDVHFKGAFTH